MPRGRRLELKAQYFHVVNRSVRKSTDLRRPSDYQAFLAALEEGLRRSGAVAGVLRPRQPLAPHRRAQGNGGTRAVHAVGNVYPRGPLASPSRHHREGAGVSRP